MLLHSENDSLETERTMMKKGNREGAKSLGGQENGCWAKWKDWTLVMEGLFLHGNKRKKMGTDSVRLRNLLTGRWSNFLLVSLSQWSMIKTTSRSGGGVGFLEESVWNGHLESVVILSWNTVPGIYTSSFCIMYPLQPHFSLPPGLRVIYAHDCGPGGSAQ